MATQYSYRWTIKEKGIVDVEFKVMQTCDHILFMWKATEGDIYLEKHDIGNNYYYSIYHYASKIEGLYTITLIVSNKETGLISEAQITIEVMDDEKIDERFWDFLLTPDEVPGYFDDDTMVNKIRIYGEDFQLYSIALADSDYFDDLCWEREASDWGNFWNFQNDNGKISNDTSINFSSSYISVTEKSTSSYFPVYGGIYGSLYGMYGIGGLYGGNPGGIYYGYGASLGPGYGMYSSSYYGGPGYPQYGIYGISSMYGGISYPYSPQYPLYGNPGGGPYFPYQPQGYPGGPYPQYRPPSYPGGPYFPYQPPGYPGYSAYRPTYYPVY